MLSANEATTRSLLSRLLEETERASASLLAESPEVIDDALSARGRTLDALERSVRALATAAAQARGTGRTTVNASLLTLASELEHANTTLMHGIRVERDLVAARIAAEARPDGVAAVYGEMSAAEVPRLDLLR